MGDYGWGIVAKIRERRLSKRMTLRQLAEASGVSTMFICDIERGNRQPSPDVASKLALALGCELPRPIPRAGEGYVAVSADDLHQLLDRYWQMLLATGWSYDPASTDRGAANVRTALRIAGLAKEE